MARKYASEVAGQRSSAPALTPPPGNPRFPLFDGLRAIAALSVLVFHAAFYSRAMEGDRRFSPYLAHLNVGVAVFFLISGFLLYRPLVAARIGDGPPVRLRDYLRRRALRIIPAFWIALTVLAIYPGLPNMFSGNWLAYYGFAQGYSRSTVLGGIGPAWTLDAEVVFYLLLPVLSLAFARAAGRVGRDAWWQFELAALALLVGGSVAFRLYARTHPSVPSSTFASTFGWFALGMALALGSALWASRRSPWVDRVARYSWLGWIAAAGAYVVLCRGLGLGGGFLFFQRESAAQSIEIYALSGVVAAGVALPAVLEPERARRPLGRFLASPPLAWLGLVSYGIYLYHEPIARSLNGGVNGGADRTVRFLWLAPATTALAIAAAALSYYVVERPALRFKDRRRARPARRARVGST